MELIFATANKNKLIEAKKILGPNFHLISPAELGFTNDVPETHDTIPENAIEKAEYIWNLFHRNCFADDSGLEVDALGGRPGVRSARYSGEPKDPKRNVLKLLEELKGVPEEKRTARFRCAIALIIEGQLQTFEGTCEGHINFVPKGVEGFGYDPVFIPEGMDKTMAMLSLDEKDLISHRGKAMEKMLCHLSAVHK